MKITFAHAVIWRKLQGKTQNIRNGQGQMITFFNAAARLKDNVYTTDNQRNKLNDYFCSRGDLAQASGKKHKI